MERLEIDRQSDTVARKTTTNEGNGGKEREVKDAVQPITEKMSSEHDQRGENDDVDIHSKTVGSPGTSKNTDPPSRSSDAQLKLNPFSTGKESVSLVKNKHVQSDDSSSTSTASSEAESHHGANKVTPQTESMEHPGTTIPPLLCVEGKARRRANASGPEQPVKSGDVVEQVLLSRVGRPPEPFSVGTDSSTQETSGPMSPAVLSKTAVETSINEGVASSPLSSRKHTNHKKGIPHVYHDFSSAPETADIVRRKTGGVTQPFPEKLHHMLDQEDDPSVVSWLPHGRAFLVRKPLEFTNNIMPKYFRQSKLTSFQRQLNLYGFRRITQGADAGAYYNELFLRGRPQLCLRMQRQKVKGTGHKQPADVQTEPNFYRMPPSLDHSTPVHSPEQSSMLEFEATPAQVTATDLSVPVASSIPEFIVTHNSCSSDAKYRTSPKDLSPDMRGVHGAAQLLQGIASGLPASSLDEPFSLGQSAAIGSSWASSSFFGRSSLSLLRQGEPFIQRTQAPPTVGSRSAHARAVAPIPPVAPEQKSLSLLARVTRIDECESSSPQRSTSNAETAAFVWPPVRKFDVSVPKVLSTESSSQKPSGKSDSTQLASIWGESAKVADWVDSDAQGAPESIPSSQQKSEAEI